jgi:hypothetical protein
MSRNIFSLLRRKMSQCGGRYGSVRGPPQRRASSPRSRSRVASSSFAARCRSTFRPCPLPDRGCGRPTGSGPLPRARAGKHRCYEAHALIDDGTAPLDSCVLEQQQRLRNGLGAQETLQRLDRGLFAKAADRVPFLEPALLVDADVRGDDPDLIEMCVDPLDAGLLPPGVLAPCCHMDLSWKLNLNGNWVSSCRR